LGWSAAVANKQFPITTKTITVTKILFLSIPALPKKTFNICLS